MSYHFPAHIVGSLLVHKAFRDRMEAIKRYLPLRQREANGVTPKHVKFLDPALKDVIESYTREAGVRSTLAQRTISGRT